MLHILRKERSAVKEHVVCHTNIVMDSLCLYYRAGCDIIVSLFSCMTEKRPPVSRLVLRHTPNPERFNTQRRKLQ
jgi:hypothetical protein